LIPIVILLLVLGVGLYLYLPKQMKDDNDFTGVVVVEEKDTFEPKTADFAQRRANEYWGNNVFDDFSANYDLMCEEIKTLVDKETFVQKYISSFSGNPICLIVLSPNLFAKSSTFTKNPALAKKSL